MSDQIKVLSRDVPKNLIDGWGMFKACLTYRKTRHPGYEREFYEIDKQVVDWFDLLILALVDEHEEPEPKWEPGILAIFKDGRTVVRLEWEIEPDLSTWWVTDMQDRTEYEQGLGFGGWRVHRLPHEFKAGDWFATKNNLVRRVAENCGDGSIVDEVGVQRLTSEIRHVPPPPKGENPKKRAWDLGAVGGQSSDCVPPPKEEKPSQERHKCDACGKQFDPDDLQILCAKCAKMQIESILDCALHSELPTDRAVETSEKPHPDPRKWELCGHDVLKKDCPTCSSEGPFQGPH